VAARAIHGLLRGRWRDWRAKAATGSNGSPFIFGLGKISNLPRISKSSSKALRLHGLLQQFAPGEHPMPNAAKKLMAPGPP
jgi:hypothetical protein